MILERPWFEYQWIRLMALLLPSYGPLIGSIWGLTCVMIHCLICKDTSPCYKCQIAHLKRENADLRNELTRLHGITNEKLQLKYWQQQEITNTFIQSKTKIKFDYKSKLSNAYFYTITFDPNKFGVEPLEDERKQYILYTLYKTIKSELLTEVYGSFEYHKNGLIHTHFIAITGYPDEIYQKLKPLYTDNPHNRIALTYGKAKYPQAQQYIEKESTHYYYFKYKESGTAKLTEVNSVHKAVALENLEEYTKVFEMEGVPSPSGLMEYTCLNPNDRNLIKKYLEKKYLV